MSQIFWKIIGVLLGILAIVLLGRYIIEVLKPGPSPGATDTEQTTDQNIPFTEINPANVVELQSGQNNVEIVEDEPLKLEKGILVTKYRMKKLKAPETHSPYEAIKAPYFDVAHFQGRQNG